MNREQLHRSVVDTLAAPAGPVLTVLTGPPGIGRTHLLGRLRESMTRAGRRTLPLRLAPEDRHEPWYLSGRVLAGLTPPPGRPGGGHPRLPEAESPGVALSRALRHHPGLVILLDDAQWADPESVSALLGALPDSARTSVRCVAALSTGPGAVPGPDVARLRAAGTLRIAMLRPLSGAESDEIVHQQLGATPHPAFRAVLRRLGRGRPAALRAVVEGCRESSAIRVVDRTAHLAEPELPPHIPADHDLTLPVRRLAPDVQAVARALAVLQPLGAAVPSLIGRCLRTPEPDVQARLGELAGHGIAARTRTGWRIRVPAMAVALGAGLGPYDRRRLARITVEAVWTGDARCDEPGFLADQAVAAGALIDPGRALTLLRAAGAAAAVTAPVASARWLTGAATLSGQPGDEAAALLAGSWAQQRAGRYDAAGTLLRRLFGTAAGRAPAHRYEAELIAVTNARARRDTAALEAMAAGRPWLPAGPEPTPALSAVALGLLGRWAEAHRTLTSRRPDDTAGTDHDGIALIDDLFTAVTGHPLSDRPERPEGAGRAERAGRAELPEAAGRSEKAELSEGADRPDLSARADLSERADLSDRPDLSEGAERAAPVGRLGLLRAAVRFRVAALAGERGDRALTGAGLTLGALGAERCLHDWLTGRWDDALDTAQFVIAADLAAGHLPGQAAVHRAAAEILLSRGRPGRAGATLTAARDDGVPLPHLLDPLAAEIAWLLGDPATAERIVRDGLARATAHGIVLGTDELWLMATELAASRGDDGTARAAAASTARVAAVAGTEVGAFRSAVASMIAGRDASLAGEVLTRARALEQPYLLARTLERVVGWTGHRPRLLAEAYRLHGDLSGLLHRSRLRQTMREHGLAVPGRAATVAESEQLLATLVAEGLSNRELAAATQSSEKSVEGRLTRLFTRTGYRSRVELAAAVLVGEYRG